MIGALIGKQEGRNIEVMNSFELLSHTVEEKIIIDKEYYYTKEEQCERGRDVGEKSGSGGKKNGEDGEGWGKKINREMGPDQRNNEERVAEETLEKEHIRIIPRKESKE